VGQNTLRNRVLELSLWAPELQDLYRDSSCAPCRSFSRLNLLLRLTLTLTLALKPQPELLSSGMGEISVVIAQGQMFGRDGKCTVNVARAAMFFSTNVVSLVADRTRQNLLTSCVCKTERLRRNPSRPALTQAPPTTQTTRCRGRLL